MTEKVLLPPGAPIDLSNRDREPIHVPGAIQPHGALLAAQAADLVVVQASVNTEAILGLAHGAVLGAPLGSRFPVEAAPVEVARAAPPGKVHAFRASIRGRPVDVAVRRSGEVLIVEVEAVPAGDDDFVRLCEVARAALVFTVDLPR